MRVRHVVLHGGSLYLLALSYRCIAVLQLRRVEGDLSKPTVINTKSHELLGSDPISCYFRKEDSVHSGHGDGGRPAVICPCS